MKGRISSQNGRDPGINLDVIALYAGTAVECFLALFESAAVSMKDGLVQPFKKGKSDPW